jgi:hypothetical protein
MRTIAALAATLTALVAAAPADAKQLTLTICGAESCRNVTDPSGAHQLLAVGGPARRPSAAPFYGVTLRAMGSAGLVRAFLYVPSAGVMRVDDATSYWTTVPPPLRAVLDETTGALEAYPASSGWDPAAPDGDGFPWVPLAAAAAGLALVAAALTRFRRRRLAAVGLAAVVAVLLLPGVAAAKGWGQARLCGPERCAAAWVPISLFSERDTPWTNGATYLLYSPSQNLLQRGRELIRLDESVAQDLEHARALGGAAARLLPWLLLAALAVAMALLAALAAALRRRVDARVVAGRLTPA